MTENNKNPIPSTDLRDAAENAELLDQIINSSAKMIPNRTGEQSIPTWLEVVRTHTAFNFRGDWQSNTAYKGGDVWKHTQIGSLFVVPIDYTSGNSEDTDINSGFSFPYQDLSNIKFARDLTDLLSNTKVKNGDIVYLQSRIPDKNIGGGFFVLDNSVKKSQHDGGITLSTTVPYNKDPIIYISAQEEASSPDDTGCFVRLKNNDGIAHACWFGVYSDKDNDFNAKIINKISPRLERNYARLSLPGGVLILSEGIKLTRGLILSGAISNDELTGTVLKRKDYTPMDYMVATPAGDSNSSAGASSYLCMEGIVIDGNRSKQSTPTIHIKFWGVYIGSWLRDIKVRYGYGPSFSFGWGMDFSADQIYSQRSQVDDGDYAVEINKDDFLEGNTSGLIDIKGLYIENVSNSDKGDPKIDPSARGSGMLIRKVYSLNITELHRENQRGTDVDGVSIFTNLKNTAIGVDDGTDADLDDSHNAMWNLVEPGAYDVFNLGATRIASRNKIGKTYLIKRNGWDDDFTKDIPVTLTRIGPQYLLSGNADPSLLSRPSFLGDTTHYSGKNGRQTERVFSIPSKPESSFYRTAEGYLYKWGSSVKEGTDVDYLSFTGLDIGAKIRFHQNIIPASSDSSVHLNIGDPNNKVGDYFGVNGVINTSDAREKCLISDLDGMEKKCAIELKGLVKKYKWKSSVQEKGENEARWHFGWIAQEVWECFTRHGLNPSEYGCNCYDQWDAEYKNVDGKEIEITPAGDRYGIRKEEILAFIVSSI